MNLPGRRRPLPEDRHDAGASDGAPTLGVGDAHAIAILDAALDAVITIDQLGRVLEFNRAAEQTFGYRKEEVLGRELGELVVPPKFREQYGRALARWTADGQTGEAGRLPGRPIDIEAMRSDGSVFSAELAISRVDTPGPQIGRAHV